MLFGTKKIPKYLLKSIIKQEKKNTVLLNRVRINKAGKIDSQRYLRWDEMVREATKYKVLDMRK